MDTFSLVTGSIVMRLKDDFGECNETGCTVATIHMKVCNVPVCFINHWPDDDRMACAIGNSMVNEWIQYNLDDVVDPEKYELFYEAVKGQLNGDIERGRDRDRMVRPVVLPF